MLWLNAAHGRIWFSWLGGTKFADCALMNKLEKITLRITYFDMKIWSRMFAVNVQSVSIHQVNWHSISQYTLTTNSFAVVYVVKTSNIRHLLKVILRNVLIEMFCSVLYIQWTRVSCVFVSLFWLTVYISKAVKATAACFWLIVNDSEGCVLPCKVLIYLYRKYQHGGMETGGTF